MSVFSDVHLTEYLSDPRIHAWLAENAVECMNLRKFITFVTEKSIGERVAHTARHSLRSTHKTRRIIRFGEYKTDWRTKAMRAFTHKLLKTSCRDKMSREYIHELFKLLVSHNSPYDICILVKKFRYGAQTARRTAMAQKGADVLGFIVVQIDGCPEYSMPSVRSKLLCVSKTAPNMAAAVLIGAFMWCTSHIREECILEIAGGYRNPPAFCLYDRMGFSAEPNLWTVCDMETNNLPMYALVKGLTRDAIVDVVFGTSDQQKSAFCTNRTNQNEIAVLMMLGERYRVYRTPELHIDMKDWLGADVVGDTYEEFVGSDEDAVLNAIEEEIDALRNSKPASPDGSPPPLSPATQFMMSQWLNRKHKLGPSLVIDR